MPPVSNRTESVAILIAIAVGWLLILAYLLMLMTNLISALHEGASGNLLARVFSFGGLGVNQPWLEAYALANVVVLTVFFSQLTRALLADLAAARRAIAGIDFLASELDPRFPPAPASLPSRATEPAAPPLTVRFAHSRKVATTGA